MSAPDLTQKGFLGTGWAFPVRVDPATGRFASVSGEDDVREAIRIIVGTTPGERVMRPDFGCGIHEMVFEVIDTGTIARITNLVTQALVRYEPRIELIAVAVSAANAANGLLEIGVDYRLRRTNQTGNLVYPFYFREGGAA